VKRALLILPLLAACAEGPIAVSAVSLSLPETVDCAGGLPDDVQAEAWQSGGEEPTELTVDENGAVSGDLVVTTGISRRLVVDWYVERDESRVLLAQAATNVDLTRPEADELDVDLGERDITVTDCRDVTKDLGREGLDIVSFRGAVVPVCDMDADCGDDGEVRPECSNLGEICAGTDPLAADGLN
jgi:hypothetical protein